MKTEVISIEELLNTIQNQEEKLDNKEKRIGSLEKEVQSLQERIDYLVRQKFSSKSEKFPSNQPSLFGDSEEEIVVEEDTELIEYTRKKGGR